MELAKEMLRLSVAIHSYYGPSLQLEITGTLATLLKGKDGNILVEKRLGLSVADLRALAQTLEALNVFGWESHYQQCCMLDGTTWTVYVEAAGKKIFSTGTNGYPDHWADFCAALDRLPGMDENFCKTISYKVDKSGKA